MAPIIRVQNVKKIYRVGKEKVVALDNINLDIEQGEICSIVGPSGSGKSTLLNQLAGLEKPNKGRVLIGKHNISEMSEKDLAIFRQQNLGFIFQSYNLLHQLTAIENVALPLMFKGVGKRQREKLARAELKKMGLGNRMTHRPTEMSGGQQQRVGIARAFVGKPKIIFADEPTGNLDSKTTKQVLASMIKLAKEEGITFVMVTHEHDLAGCADRIVTLKDGQIVKDERTDGSWYEKLEAEAALEAEKAAQIKPENGPKGKKQGVAGNAAKIRTADKAAMAEKISQAIELQDEKPQKNGNSEEKGEQNNEKK
ncbi:MAG: ABC transporter ATP-binding protein [Oscillospiraceae bacterium]|nr:ABC transporter ATP-binding protein [Oscillospiraceae bacterium]